MIFKAELDWEKHMEGVRLDVQWEICASVNQFLFSSITLCLEGAMKIASYDFIALYHFYLFIKWSGSSSH